jgi:hypothetical protein
LLLKGFHLTFELGDLGAIGGHRLLRRLEFATEFLSHDSSNFTLEDVGDIGHGYILVSIIEVLQPRAIKKMYDFIAECTALIAAPHCQHDRNRDSTCEPCKMPRW